jgi:4-diphosphocytidyl-2-C-methyl-D-erythritol kinase
MIARRAPAKVNLYLQVLGKRPDGYHELLSLMQAIDLCDALTFAVAPGLSVLCPDAPLPVDRENLVYRAAEAFYQRIAAPPSCRITLRKRIPAGAGLGGGSSDAATTLMALNDLHGRPSPRRRSPAWGRPSGRTSPFSSSAPTAWATGIGERLMAAPPLPPSGSFWSIPASPSPPYGL